MLAATNWQEIAPKLPGYLGFFPPIVAAGLLHAPTYGGTVSASAYPYDSLALPLETNPLTDPLLGRPGFPVLHHGAFAHRIDKVAAVASWPVALKHLRPCDAPTVEGGACARCRKCVQTALAFCALGLPVPPSLGGAPPSIGDIERFEMTPYALLGLRDVLAAARSRNIGAPWLAAVEQRIAAADPMSVGADDAAGLRRRLEHALGGPGGSGPMRFVRRVARAIRGADDPPSAAPVRPVVPAPSPGRPSPARPSPATAPAPGFAVSAGGRRLYVDGDDLRGAALMESAGNLFPAALAMWKLLVASGRWTHVVDVGANYGEMIVDLDVGPEIRLIAVEPNPRIAACLERSMAEAGRPIELVRKVVCDRDGTAELTIDRTWSGMSSLRVHPVETRGHDLATIQMESATLRSLLADATPDGEKRVAVKIDVEGQELAALRGLEGRATAFGAFAAMIEVRHFDASDFSAVLETFTIDLFDMRSKALVEIADATPARLLDLLASGDFHPHDAVLRPRT